MNKIPSNVDDILSLLGEVDIIKAALGSFDKSINIALASDKVSDLIGPEGHFYVLKKMEMIHAATVGLSVELLNIAEKLAVTNNQVSMEPEKTPDPSEVNLVPNKNNTPNIENPLVNNVLDYLNERLTAEDGEE
jgi:hypothetical protein